MTLTVEMEAAERLEIGFGRVVEGREEWVSGEYFPTVGPVMARHGFRTLVPFAVLDSNLEGVAPLAGSLAGWPSAEHRRRLHEAPEFVAIRPMRDASVHLSDGHLFEPLPGAVELDPEGDFALVVAAEDVSVGEAVFRVPFASDSANRAYAGRFLSIHRWSDACERLLAESPARAVVLRVRLQSPA